MAAAQVERSSGSGGGVRWVLAALVLAVVGALIGLRRGGALQPAETRAYLRLVELCRRARVIERGVVVPLELIEELDARGHRAAGPARRLVELYLRARFGAQPLAPAEHHVLADALGRARAALRTA